MGDVILFPSNHDRQLREQTDSLVAKVTSLERKLGDAVKDAEKLLGDVVVRQLFDEDPKPPTPVA